MDSRVGLALTAGGGVLIDCGPVEPAVAPATASALVTGGRGSRKLTEFLAPGVPGLSDDTAGRLASSSFSRASVTASCCDWGPEVLSWSQRVIRPISVSISAVDMLAGSTAW